MRQTPNEIYEKARKKREYEKYLKIMEIRGLCASILLKTKGKDIPIHKEK